MQSATNSILFTALRHCWSASRCQNDISFCGSFVYFYWQGPNESNNTGRGTIIGLRMEPDAPFWGKNFHWTLLLLVGFASSSVFSYSFQEEFDRVESFIDAQSDANQTIFFGHYPTSTISSPHPGIRHLLGWALYDGMLRGRRMNVGEINGRSLRMK